MIELNEPSSSSPSPALSIIMPCHNRGYDLPRVLDAYEAQTIPEQFELIAVDDASNDSTVQILQSYQSRRFQLKLECQETHQGPAAARNRGISLATAPLIVFVGDDILPEANFVQRHIDAHRRHSELEIAILGRVVWPEDLPTNTLMLHIDGIGAQQFSYHYFKDGEEYDFRHLYTANVSLKRAFLLQLSRWFDTDFPYPAFEDAELGFRLAQRGLRIKYDATILVRHYHYHTIWSFALRQYKSGLMAWLFTRKHPIGVGRVLVKQYLRIIAMLRKPRAILCTDRPEKLERLETLVMHLASAHEWNPNSFLDSFYLNVLDYFYYRGLIDGIFGKSFIAKRLRIVCARQLLLPVLTSLQRNSKESPIPSVWNWE